MGVRAPLKGSIRVPLRVPIRALQGFGVLGVDSDGSRVHKGSGLWSLGLGFRV